MLPQTFPTFVSPYAATTFPLKVPPKFPDIPGNLPTKSLHNNPQNQFEGGIQHLGNLGRILGGFTGTDNQILGAKPPIFPYISPRISRVPGPGSLPHLGSPAQTGSRTG